MGVLEMKITERDLQPIMADITKMLLDKNQDYAKHVDNLSIFGINGICVRLTDKVIRGYNLTKEGSRPKNESLEDTLKDIIGYGVLALLMHRKGGK